jgi:hypothetical protein
MLKPEFTQICRGLLQNGYKIINKSRFCLGLACIARFQAAKRRASQPRANRGNAELAGGRWKGSLGYQTATVGWWFGAKTGGASQHYSNNTRERELGR